MSKPSYSVQTMESVMGKTLSVEEPSQSYKAQKSILRDNLERSSVVSHNTGVPESTLQNTPKQRKYQSTDTKESAEIPAKKPTEEPSELLADAKTEDLIGATHLMSEPSSLVQAREACVSENLSSEASRQFKVAKSDIQKNPIFAHAKDLLLNHKCSVNEVHKRTGLSRSTLLFTLEHLKLQSVVTTDVIIDSHTEDSNIAPSKVLAEESPKDQNLSVNAVIQNTDVFQSSSQNTLKQLEQQFTVTTDTTVNLKVEDSAVVPVKKYTKDLNRYVNAVNQNTDKLKSTVTADSADNLQVKDFAVLPAKKPTKDHKWSVNTASRNTSMFQSTLQNFFKQQKRKSSLFTYATDDPQTENFAVMPPEMLPEEPNEDSTEILAEESIEELAEIPAEAKIEEIVRPPVGVKRFAVYQGRKIRVVEKEVDGCSQTAYFPQLLSQINLHEKLHPRTHKPLFVEQRQLTDKLGQQTVFNGVSTANSRSDFLNFYPVTTSQPGTSSQKVMGVNAFDSKGVNDGLLLGMGDSAAKAHAADDSINITDDASDTIDDSEKQLLPGPWWLSEIYSFIRWLVGYKRGSHGENSL